MSASESDTPKPEPDGRRISRGFVALCAAIGLLITVGSAGAYVMATAYSASPVHIPPTAWPALATDGRLDARIDSGLLQVHEEFERPGLKPEPVRVEKDRGRAFFAALLADQPTDLRAPSVTITGDPDAALEYGILAVGPAAIGLSLAGAWLGGSLLAMLGILAVRRFWEFLTPDWQKPAHN